MLRRLGALVLCLSLVTAGCIGSVRAGTAQEHRERADEQADRFAGPNAELVSVLAMESNGTARAEEEDSRDDRDEDRSVYSSADTIPDDRIGDGEAPVWIYSYRTSNSTYRVAVDENGTVIANETDDDVDEDQHPIDSWEVTSEEAAEIVDENNDTWSTDGKGFGIYFLSQEDATGDPIWKLGQISEIGFIFARVNANTGEYLGAETFTFDFGFDFSMGPFFGGGDDEGPPEQPEQEGGTFSGTLTAAESTAEHTFEIEEDGHRELGARLALQGQSTASDVNATIEGPNGTVGTLETSGDTVETIQDWPDPPEGDYTITVQLDQGVAQDYEIDWCASGETAGDEEVDQACGRVAQGTQPTQDAAPIVTLG